MDTSFRWLFAVVGFGLLPVSMWLYSHSGYGHNIVGLWFLSMFSVGVCFFQANRISGSLNY